MMTPRGFSRVEELYHAALQRPSVERKVFLEEACRGDQALLREVESLLGYEEEARNLLEEPVRDAATRKLTHLRGTRLGRYEVSDLIGAGGMGEIYRARDTSLGRDVAIKVLPDASFGEGDRLGRFEQEARAVGALNHPNVLDVHDIGVHDGAPYVVTELLEGETLRDRLGAGALPMPEAIGCAVQIADGLAAAHAKGIVHRDLKPENLFLTRDGRVKILDFGLAKLMPRVVDRGSTTTTTLAKGLTGAGVLVGTVAYMSPEQARGEEQDVRTDLFSLGAVLYELATGRRAFTGSTAVTMIDAILHEDPPSPVRLNPAVPVELERIITKCLEKDRDLRYQSASELRADLKRLKRDADETRSAAHGGVTTGAPEHGASQQPPYAHWRKRALPAGVAALVAVLAVLGLLLWSRVRPGPPETGRSVAVLPLVTLGGDADDEYFSTGLTEDIVTHLSKIPELDVVSSLSSLRYRDTDKGLREIGEELGVATLLVGKIRRQADRVRVNVELIDASTSRNLWAEVFEGRMSDIFAIQSEIAEKLAARLEVELSAETERQVEQVPTVDPEAYELALRGRYLRKRETPESLVQAAELFEKAIEKDPDYALAWAGLAEVYFLQAYLYTRQESQAELFDKAVRVVERALELDGALAEGHVVKGILLAHHVPREAAAAETELRHAIELNPRLANAHRELGVLLLRTMGRVEEAVEQFLVADELEPFWFLVKFHLIEAYLEKGDLVSATERLPEVREVVTDPYWNHPLLAWVNAAFQEFGRAEPLVEDVVEGNRPTGLRWAALFLALEGRTGEAAALVDRAARIDSEGVGPFVVKNHSTAGVIELFEGEYRAAARHLEAAYEDAPDPVGWGTWCYSVVYLDYATLLGYAYLKTGDEDRAHRLLEETELFYTGRIARGDTSFRARVGIAAVHALRGEKEAAYDWLQQAIGAGFYQYAELERHPCFESLHGEERFQRMMAGVAARVEEMRRRVDLMHVGDPPAPADDL